MQRVFNFSADNSELIRGRQRLEQSRLSSHRVDERLATPPKELEERVAQVGALLDRVVASQTETLRGAGINLPIQFGVRAEENGGPGCILSGNRYVIAAGSNFICNKIVLLDVKPGDKAKRLTDLLDKAPDTPNDPHAIALYAKENLASNTEFNKLPRQYPWIDEKTLEGIFLHEMSHIVNGDPVALFATTPEQIERIRPLLFVGLTLVFGGALALLGVKATRAFAIGALAALPTTYIITWIGWKAYASTDRMTRQRETAADHTLIQSQEMMETMARQFKRDTVLEAIHHLRSGKSVDETAKLLQTESRDHPKPLTRWRSFYQRLKGDC